MGKKGGRMKGWWGVGHQRDGGAGGRCRPLGGVVGEQAMGGREGDIVIFCKRTVYRRNTNRSRSSGMVVKFGYQKF